MSQVRRSLSRRDLLDAAHLGYHDKLNNVIFHVIDNFLELKQKVVHYLRSDDTLKSRPLTIVYDVSQGNGYWTAFVLQGNTRALYFMNPQGGTKPGDLKGLCEQFIFNEKKISPPCEHFDCGIVALHNALNTNEILKTRNDIEMYRTRCADQVETMNTQRAKLDTLLKKLTIFPNDLTEFSYMSANIFIYFLETMAFQNDATAKYKTQLIKLMGEADVDLVSLVRTKFLVHRDRNTAEIMEPCHLQVFINESQLNGVSTVQAFFDNLKYYVRSAVHVANHIDAEISDHVIPPRLFLKGTAVSMGNRVSQQTLNDEVEMYLRNVLKETFKSSRCIDEQKFIFYLIINFAPYFTAKKCPKTLEKIQDLRNLQIHDFYKLSDGEFATKNTFFNFLREHRNCLFKCFYARDVYKLVNDLNTNINDDSERDRIVKALEDSLDNIKTEIGDEETGVPSPSIEEDCKLLLVIANENSIKSRKEKLYEIQVTSTRYDLLSIGDLMSIRTELAKLKQLKNDDAIKYLEESTKLELDLESHYDILKRDFKLLIDLIINDIENTDRNLKAFMARIKHDLKALTQELECSINNKFTVGHILKVYNARGNRSEKDLYTKGSFEEKMSLIHDGFKTKVLLQTDHDVEICSDTFVATIFEMQSNEDRRRMVYCDVQEAFDDPGFIEYIEAQDIKFPNLIGKSIDKVPPYLAPLLSRIIAKHNIKELVPLKHILPLLRDKSISHIVKLLDYAHSSKNKFSLICETFWDIINSPSFDFESIEIVFEDNDRVRMKGLITECIKYIGKATDQARNDTRGIVWKLLQSYETAVVKRLFSGDHPGSLQMLLEVDDLEEIAKNTKNCAPEVLWQIQLIEAKIKLKVWELNRARCGPFVYQACLDGSIEALTHIKDVSSPDRFEKYYFVTLNYLGKALHSRKRSLDALNTYIYYQTMIVQHCFQLPHTSTTGMGGWTRQMYDKILSSESYKKISDGLATDKYYDINDYPNIFRLRKNIAYHLQCRGVRNGDIGECQKALDLLKEVLAVLESLDGAEIAREVLRTKKTMCKVFSDLGKALMQRGLKADALHSFKQCLRLTTDVFRAQKGIFWDSHPAVVEYFYYTIYAFENIAQLRLYLNRNDKRSIYSEFESIVQADLDHVNNVSREYKVIQINNCISYVRSSLCQ